MLERIKALTKRLKKVFPKGYVSIDFSVMIGSFNTEDMEWMLHIDQINLVETFKSELELLEFAENLIKETEILMYSDVIKEN